MLSKEDQIMMETMYWWGIPTLFRCKNDPDPKNCDIALVGVPHSTGNGTTECDQHLGPRAVRHVSAGLRRVHLDMQINPWEKKIINDLGDVPLPEANNNKVNIVSVYIWLPW
jgi:guanidinopropionase